MDARPALGSDPTYAEPAARAGHRQNFTELEIVSIDGKRAKAADKTMQKPAPGKDKAEDKEQTDTKTEATQAKTSSKKVAKKSTKTAASDAGTKRAAASETTVRVINRFGVRVFSVRLPIPRLEVPSRLSDP